MYKLHFPLEQPVDQTVHKQMTASTLLMQHHPVGTHGCDVIPRPRRKRDVSGENIPRRPEPWQSEGLSETAPRGTEVERIGTPCQLDLKGNQEREREHSTGRGGEGHRVVS